MVLGLRSGLFNRRLYIDLGGCGCYTIDTDRIGMAGKTFMFDIRVCGIVNIISNIQPFLVDLGREPDGNITSALKRCQAGGFFASSL